MEKDINLIRQEALSDLEAAGSKDNIKALSVKYLGRKGFVTLFLRNVSNLSADIRPQAGRKANEVKKEL